MNQRIVIGTVIWGEEYIDKFLRYGISSLILEQVDGSKIEVKFIVVTSTGFRDYLENSFSKVNWPAKFSWQIIESEALSTIFNLEKILGIQFNKYILHSHGFNLILKNLEDGDIYVSNYGDFAWSENAIVKILEIFSDKKIDLITCHPLTMGENSLSDLESMRNKNEKLKLNPIALIDISLKTASWWYDQYTWGSSKTSDYLSLLYWKIAENTYLFRGFHIHPLAFKLKNSLGQSLPKIEFGTLDGHYYPRILLKNGWKDYFIKDLNELCVATWTSKTKSYYFQNEKNFSVRLKSHIQNNQVRSELANLEKYVLIGNSNSDVSKMIEISTLNLEKTLSKVQIKDAIGNEEELYKELRFVEKVENIKRLELLFLIFQLLIVRISIFVFLRPILFFIRKKNKIRSAITKLKTSFILKNAIKRFQLIEFFQNTLGFELLITQDKLDQYRLELISRLEDLNKGRNMPDSYQETKLKQLGKIQGEKFFVDTKDIKSGNSQRYLVSLQTKSELRRHYKKRTRENLT